MFGRNVMLRNSDAHSIFDLQTGKRINHASDTVLGEHVWMAHGTTAMKGTRIGAHSIVGAFSAVTGGEYPPNALIAGIPAKVIRTGVIWDRWFGETVHDETLSDYLSDYLPDALAKPHNQ